MDIYDLNLECRETNLEVPINVPCKRCNSFLENPICIACHNNKIIYWLKEKIVNREIIGYILRDISNRFPMISMNNEHCISCRRGMVILCRDCYTLEISCILKRLNLDTSLESFKQYTNTNNKLNFIIEETKHTC